MLCTWGRAVPLSRCKETALILHYLFMAGGGPLGHENDRTAAIVTSKALLAYYAENGRSGIAIYRHMCGFNSHCTNTDPLGRGGMTLRFFVTIPEPLPATVISQATNPPLIHDEFAEFPCTVI